jgi:hypothetical protein
MHACCCVYPLLQLLQLGGLVCIVLPSRPYDSVPAGSVRLGEADKRFCPAVLPAAALCSYQCALHRWLLCWCVLQALCGCWCCCCSAIFKVCIASLAAVLVHPAGSVRLLPCSYNAAAEDRQGKFPVIVFSHGCAVLLLHLVWLRGCCVPCSGKQHHLVAQHGPRCALQLSCIQACTTESIRRVTLPAE